MNSERKQEGRRKPAVGVAPLAKKGQLVEDQAKVLRLRFDSSQSRFCISVRQSSSNSPALSDELDELNEELETGPLIRTPVLDREELDEINEELETGPLIRTPVFPEIGAR